MAKKNKKKSKIIPRENIPGPGLEGSGDPLAITETAREQAATDRNAFDQTATGRETAKDFLSGFSTYETNPPVKCYRHKHRNKKREC